MFELKSFSSIPHLNETEELWSELRPPDCGYTYASNQAVWSDAYQKITEQKY